MREPCYEVHGNSIYSFDKKLSLGGGELRKHCHGLVCEKGDTSSVLPCFVVCVSYSKFRGKPPSPQGEGFSHCKFNLYCKEFQNAIQLYPESGANGNLSLLLEEKVATKSTDEVSPLQ